MNTPEAWGVALLRIVLGVIFVMHGYWAFATLGHQRLADMIVRIGNPETLAPLMAWYVIAAHAVGGLLLVLGLWASPAAIAQVPIMAAAVFLLHWPEGFFMRAQVVDAAAGRAVVAGYEFPLLVLTASLVIALTGSGALSVDGARQRRLLRRAIP
ncbi:MAG: DoxX family protein [Candidatus Rokuibacteriota bacterium]